MKLDDMWVVYRNDNGKYEVEHYDHVDDDDVVALFPSHADADHYASDLNQNRA